MGSISMVLSNLGKAKYFKVYRWTTIKKRQSVSVNGGKYKFRRLPFGLKNASSIFQRVIDDVLCNIIGKTCYLYFDEAIVFFETEEDHQMFNKTCLLNFFKISQILTYINYLKAAVKSEITISSTLGLEERLS